MSGREVSAKAKEAGSRRSSSRPQAAAAHRVLDELGPGEPLPSHVAGRFSPELGPGLQSVTLHRDARGAAVASANRARAFAIGEHVAFGAGQFRPGTPVGDALLAHELAHARLGGDAGARAESAANAVAAGAVTRLWAGATPRSRPAALPAGGGLQLHRCDAPELADATIVHDEEMRALGYEPRPPPGEPIVGRTYHLSLKYPPTPPQVVAEGTPTSSLVPADLAAWFVQAPGDSEFRRRPELGTSHDFVLEKAGEWAFAIEVPFGGTKYGILVHRVTARDPDEVAREKLQGVKPISQGQFLVNLEVQNLYNVHLAVADQRFAPAYISLQGSNPADATAMWPNLPVNVYTAHSPPGQAAVRYQWVAVPANLRDYVTENRFGQPRRTVGGREGFDLGTGSTASWTIAHETGVVLVYCTMYDRAGTAVAEAAYQQVVLSPEERKKADTFARFVGDVRAELRKLRESTAVFVPAVHLDTASGLATELSLFFGKAADSEELAFIDVTPGVPRREYRGATFDALLGTFGTGNSYPPGQVMFQVPGNSLGVEPKMWRARTSGASLAQKLSTGWGWASLGLAGLGVVAAVFPGTQPLAPAFFLASAGLGAASAGASLYQHSQEAHPSGVQVAIDIVQLAGSLIGAAGAANVLRHGPRIAAATRTGQFVLYAGFATDVVGGVLIAVDGATQIAGILEQQGRTEDKVAAVVRLLSGMLLQGALLAWSAKSLSATRGALESALGPEAVKGLSSPELHALGVLDEAALARLAGAKVDDVKAIAALIRQDPVLAGQLAQLHGGTVFLQAARVRPRDLDELTRLLAVLKARPQLGPALAQAPKLMEAMARNDTVRDVLIRRPEALESLLKHPEAIEMVEKAIAEAASRTTRGAPAAPTKLSTPLSRSQLDISAKAQGTVAGASAAQAGFEAARIGDKPYLERYLDGLYRQAEVAQSELNAVTDKVAGATKGQPGYRPGAKSRSRSMDKITGDYGGDASKLNDLAGTKIVYQTLDDLYHGLEQAEKELGGKIVGFEDRFITPERSGYRDIRMNVRMSNGHVAEFRLHLASIEAVAEFEHAAYELRRSIKPVAGEAGRAMTAAEVALEDALLAVAQQAYNDALARGMKAP